MMQEHEKWSHVKVMTNNKILKCWYQSKCTSTEFLYWILYKDIMPTGTKPCFLHTRTHTYIHAHNTNTAGLTALQAVPLFEKLRGRGKEEGDRVHSL